MLSNFQAVDGEQNRADLQFLKAKTFRRIAAIKRFEEARIPILQKATQNLEELNREFPQNPDIEFELANAYLDSLDPDNLEFRSIGNSTVKIAESLVARENPKPEYFDCLLKALSEMQRFAHFSDGDLVAARGYIEKCEQASRDRASRWPNRIPSMADVNRQSMQALICYFSNDFKQEWRHQQLAVRLLERRSRVEDLTADERKEMRIRRSGLNRALGESRFRYQRVEAGMELIQAAIDQGVSLFGSALSELDGDDPSFRARFQYRVGLAQWYFGIKATAKKLFEDAIAGYRSNQTLIHITAWPCYTSLALRKLIGWLE